MFSADTHIRTIGEAEHGTARLAVLADAIREADEAGAHNWRFYFRFENIRESVFHDDAFKAILSFPELLKIYDEHPELEDEYEDDMLLAFKWVIENATDFYQVSREQIDRNFEEYKRRCEYSDVSMRVYHMKRCNFLRMVDMNACKAEYEAFKACKRDGYSDCEACETNFAMQIAFELGEDEEALRTAKPILEGSLRCGEIPHYTFCHLTEHYLYAGDLDEASYYGELCARYTQGNPEFLAATGTLLALYSATDPSHGWTIFKQCLSQYVSCKNPTMRLRFADGAYRLMYTLCELNEQEGDAGLSTSPVLRILPLKMTEEGMKLSDVRDYFYQESRELAKQLDRRNRSDYYAQKLSRTIVPVDFNASLIGENPRSAHGITRRLPCLLFASLPEGVKVSYADMEQRIREKIPEDAELISSNVDEDGLYVSYRREGKLYDYMLTVSEIPEAPPSNPVADLSDEDFMKMVNNPVRYILRTTLGEPAQVSYQYTMEFLYTALPETFGIFDILTRHAYSGNWVRFAAAHEAAVSPSDLFGLYLTGDEQSGEVWMSTVGMNVLGMRELEINGATTANFRKFADMLDRVAAQIVDRGILPDEGEPFGMIYVNDEPYHFKWKQIPDMNGTDTIAAKMERDLPCGMLLLETDTGDIPVAECDLLLQAQELNYPTGNREFRRRIALARQTFHYVQEAVKKPFARCAVRLEFTIPEELRKDFGYSLELLWGEVVSVENSVIKVEIKETEETLPDIHEGDIVTVDPEKVAGWMFKRTEEEAAINEQGAYLLA